MADQNKPNRKRTYLEVPFKEKDAAHDAGAKFDRRLKKWYVPGGTDIAPFARWMPKEDPQAPQASTAARRPGDTSRVAEQEKLLGSEADFEREATRISEVVGQPIEEAREFVRDRVRAVEENAALAARDYFLKQGRAFDAVDGIREAIVQARHQFFAERQDLYKPRAPHENEIPAPTLETRANIDDAALGRRYREAIQSLAASATLHGGEVNRTLLLDQRLETIHRDAWRKSGDAADGERAIGEQIRTRTGFAAEELPPQATHALNKLREEAGLEPIEVDERPPEADARDPDPQDDPQLSDPASVAPLHQHRHRDPDPDAGMATFADIADALEQEEARRTLERGDAGEQALANPEAAASEKKVDWIAENAQSAKMVADRRGLTDRIESEFAQGKTAAEVTAELDKDLRFLPLMERGAFVMHVRHALGIPSQISEDGKREFAQWKAEYDQRNTNSADLSAIEPAEPGAQPSVPGAGEEVTFADVGEAAEIDDAMRRRGLTGNAAPGMTRNVDASTASAGAANEEVAQPGKAANEDSDTRVLDGSAGPSVRHQQAPAQNEPNAKNPVNEPTRPVRDTVSEQDLKRLSKLRANEREAAEATLREQNKPMEKADASPEGESAKAGDAGDASGNQIGVDPASRKPIVKKDGYDVPTGVASRYMVKEGRFWKLDGVEAKPGTTPINKPHFEDVGARLKTQQNDRATIADMLAIAEAKNWDSIVVRGDETFRRNAWIEASLSGADMTRFKGFKPKESDEALLEVAKRERAALTIKAGKSPESPEPSADKKNEPTADQPSAQETGPAMSAESATPGAPAKPVDAMSGELLAHGSARYQHKPDASYSYFVRYRDGTGAERTVWGVDLKRAIGESGAKAGDTVSLKNLGEKPVTVDDPIRDAKGKVIDNQPKETIRNTWEVTRTVSAEPEHKPDHRSAAPEPARLTVEQMREQLARTIEQLPARTRTELLNRFDARMQAGTEIEARIERGELSRDSGAAEIDKRAAELHAGWTAPKAAPTSSPSNKPQTEQQQTRGPMPNLM